MLLPLTLCAGCMPVYVEASIDDPCSEYVPAEMWQPTPHAQPPGTSQASHANFEVAEAGQLEKANDKPPAIEHIVTTCETNKKKAVERAKHKLEPWWKRIF